MCVYVQCDAVQCNLILCCGEGARAFLFSTARKLECSVSKDVNERNLRKSMNRNDMYGMNLCRHAFMPCAVYTITLASNRTVAVRSRLGCKVRKTLSTAAAAAAAVISIALPFVLLGNGGRNRNCKPPFHFVHG